MSVSAHDNIVVMRRRKQQDSIATSVENKAETVKHISPQHWRIARFRISEDAECPSKGLRSFRRLEPQGRSKLDVGSFPPNSASDLLDGYSRGCSHLLQATGIQK